MNQPKETASDTPPEKSAVLQLLNPPPCLRILLLEDVATDAELIERELKQSDILFVSRCVQTHDDFLKALEDFLPDVILSDFTMPQFTAIEALQLLHQQARDVPFILVTGSQSEEVAVECMKLGADDYILKATLKRLPSALLNAMQKHRNDRERFRAIVALQRSEEHFRSLIENALDIIFVLKSDGTFHYVSPSVRGLGYKPEELSGKSLLSLEWRLDKAGR